MSNFIFNNAKGKVAYYASLPDVGSALVAVPLQTAGVEPDATMVAHSSLETLLAASTEQTTLGRKTLSGVSVSIVNNTAVVDANDFVYTAGSGAPVTAFVICYVPENGVSGDGDIIPLTKHDFSLIPTGVDIPVQIATGGLFVASSPGI